MGIYSSDCHPGFSTALVQHKHSWGFLFAVFKIQLPSLHFYKGIPQVGLALSKFLMEVWKQSPGSWLFLCQTVQISIFCKVAFNNLLKEAFSATFLLEPATQIEDSFSCISLESRTYAQTVRALTALGIHSSSCCIDTPFFHVLTMKIIEVIFNFACCCNCIFSFWPWSQGTNSKEELCVQQLQQKSAAAQFGKDKV